MGRWGLGRLALAATICAGAFATGCKPAPTEGWRSELVSTGLTGAPATIPGASARDISPDGTRVLIGATSPALGFPSVGPPALSDLFMRDLRTGELTRITSTPDGTSGGNGQVNEAAFSPDGTSVVFVTSASNLGPIDTNLLLDVYTYDIASREITLVSANFAGTGSGNSQSHTASFSPDGTQVVFTSQATDLGPTDTNNTWDVYVRYLTSDETQLVSANSLGTGPGDQESSLQSGLAGSPFSADGRFVIFLSNSGNLTTDPPNGTRNVFVRDLVDGTTERASLTDAGQGLPGGAAAFAGAISPSGSLVAFTALVSDSSVPPPLPPFRLDLYVRDLAADTLTQLPATGAGDLVFSPDGRTFAFTTMSSVDTGVPDTNGQFDVHLYEVAERRLRLASVDATGTRAASGPSQTPSYSRDGRSLMFISGAADIVPGMSGPSTDLYLRSLDEESTTLVSVDRAGAGRAGGVSGSRARISADGRSVSYSSSSQALAGVPVPQGFTQAYVAHLTPFPRADLAMVSADSPTQVAPGEPWTITASAENRGPDTVDRVVVAVLVPAGIGAVVVDGGAGATCTTSAPGAGGEQVVTCVTESLAVGATRQVAVSGTTPVVAAGTELTAVATVGASRIVDPVANGTIVTTSTVVDPGPPATSTTTSG
jgi:Tol biopolymer transport system component